MTFDISKLEQEIKERGNIHRLDNGVTIISENNPGFGLVQGSITVMAGALHEELEDHGVMHFLEHMTFNGSRQYPNPSEMMMRAGVIGLNTNASTSLDRVSFPVQGANETRYLLQTNALEAFRMVADTAFHPSLDAATIEKERAIIQREREEKTKMRADDPFMKIGEAMDQRLYGNNWRIMGYRGGVGTKESIDRITTNTLRDYHDRFFVGENTIASMGGDLNGLQREIEKLFDGVPRGVKAQRISYVSEEPFHGREVVEFSAPVRATDVFVYFQVPGNIAGLEGNTTSLAALEYVLGRTPQSLLFQDLRERRGLVYSVGCTVVGHERTSFIKIHYAVDSKRLDESLQAVEENLDAVKRGVFSPDLIEAYKAAYLPKTIWDFRQPGWVYMHLAMKHQVEEAGQRWQGFDNLRDLLSLRKQDVVDAANKYLTEDRLMFIVRPE